MSFFISRYGDVDGCGGFFEGRRCLVVAAAPHTRMHTVVSPEVGAATLEIRKKEACKDERGRKRAQLSDTATERI